MHACRVWECSWDYAEKRFIPTVEKYAHLKKKKDIDKAVSCELCLTTETISDIRQALDKRSWLMEKKGYMSLFTKLQLYHFKFLPSPRKEPQKVEYILNELNGEDTITVQRIQELKKEYEKSNVGTLPEGQFDVIYADPPWRYEIDYFTACMHAHGSVYKGTTQAVFLGLPMFRPSERHKTMLRTRCKYLFVRFHKNCNY